MRLWMILVVCVVFIYCKNKEENELSPDKFAIPDTVLVWDVDADSMIMKKEVFITDSLVTINRIINGLNAKYPEIHIDVIKQSNDTLHIAVPDAAYLGEQMGSLGATNWFADAVINLTAVPGINYVSFLMDTHSHAASGVIGREEYKDWKKIN